MVVRVVLVLFCFLMLAHVALAADPSLIGWWSLDEDSGTVALDASGQGNDGALSENVTWTPDAGRFRGAALYDGADTAHIEISASDMSASAGTVMMWGYLSDPLPAHTTQYFFGHTTQPSYANRIQIYMDGSTSDLDIGLGGSHTLNTDIVTLPTASWLHVALTWDAGNYAVYLDGESIATGSYSGLTDIHDIAHIGNDGNPDSQGTEAFSGMLDECRLYDRALSQEEIQTLMRTGAGMGTAVDPVPASGATDVLRDVTLGWTAGEFAATHDVYFGTSFDDVNAAGRDNPLDVLLSEGQNAASHQPLEILEFGQTYYWRVDEVNAAPDYTIFKGDVWSFTTEPVGYPVEGVIASTNAIPQAGSAVENTVNGSGLNELDQHSVEAGDMWLGLPGADPVTLQYEFDGVYKLHEMLVWNYNVQFELVLGFGLKDVTVEYSIDGVEWTALGDVELAQGTATPDYAANSVIDFGGVAAKYVKLTVNGAYGMMGQYGLSEVRFLSIPAQASEPAPADGAADVSVDAALAWRSGRDAVSHDLYLGADADTLVLAETVQTASYQPDALDFGTTYAWRVDENQEAESWEGPVWSFSTQEYQIVEDFEGYDDDANRIYESWIDGYGVNTNGSQVGYLESPFAEQTIVNSGAQSMPLVYANTGGATVSEATRDLGALDMDTNGAEYLRLFVSGSAPAFFEAPDGTIVMNGIGNDIWNAADQFRYVYKTLTGDGSLIARVDALDGAPNSWAKGGVMIRQDTEAGAVNAFMALTGGSGGGATFQQRPDADVATVSQHTLPGNPFAPPYWVRLDREGNAFSAYLSPDGETWTQAAETVTVNMADPVLIGLALTSHNDAQVTGAAFSNISSTGAVTGGWQVAEIGLAQLDEGNEPQPLYVTLEDNAGQTVSVTHPNAAATALSGWNEWLIPYSDLTGVNLNSIASMTIGVGNPNGGGSGSGLIFIDDIGFGRPAATDGN